MEPDLLPLTEEYAEAVEELDEALERLAGMSPRKARLLEQRYFGGLKLEECAEALGVSLATVKIRAFFGATRTSLASKARSDQRRLSSSPSRPAGVQRPS